MKQRLYIFIFLSFFIIFQGSASFASELAAKICDIRQLFCGEGGFGVVMFAIVVLGLMVFSGKMHWSVLFITGIGIVIFISADQFVNDLTGDVGAVDSNCECF